MHKEDLNPAVFPVVRASFLSCAAEEAAIMCLVCLGKAMKHRAWERWDVLESLEKDGGLICIVLLLTDGMKFGQHLFYCITITGHHVM